MCFLSRSNPWCVGWKQGPQFPRAVTGANAQLAAVGRRKAAAVAERIAAQRQVDQRLGSESRSHRGRPETAGLAAVAADGRTEYALGVE